MNRTTLGTGLRLVTERVPSSRTFSVGFFVPVGSRHESPRLSGASHFLEHVLFKGTRRRSAEEISVAIESVGGDLNAYTAKEHTCFYGRVVDRDAALAVDVLGDMITSSLITTADVEAERAVIIDELSMHADDPAEVAAELVAETVFGPRGLGAPVAGHHASVSALDRNQVVRHWRRHYRSDDLVVAATGRVDHAWLTEQLASIPSVAVGTPRPRAPRPTGPTDLGGLVTARRGVEQSTAVLAFPTPGLFDPSRAALGLLALIIGGGTSSRLFLEIRERRGLTYGIDAGETAYTDAGLWSVEWQCAPSRLATIATLVKQILLDVAEHGVTADELRRAQSQMRGQTTLAYESPVARMSRLGSNALVGDERSIAELLADYDAVTVDDLQRTAATLFGTPPVLAVVGPRVGTRALESVLRGWPG